MKGRYNTSLEASLGDIISHLRQRIERLEAGSRAGYTAIDKGSLNIKSGSLIVGDTATFGDSTPRAALYRADGTIAFTIDGPDDHQSVALFDANGNTIMADDAVAAQGLSRPWLPLQWQQSSTGVPTINTTSGTFTPLMSSTFFKQHPQVYVAVLAYCSDGTTAGQAQLMVANSVQQIGTTQTIPAGYYGLIYFGPAPVLGDHMSEIEIEVQVRRTAGAGSVGIRVWSSYGMESF